jgi:hypothetical protein
MKPLIGISRDFVCWVVAHKFFCRDSMEALAAKKEIANHGGNFICEQSGDNMLASGDP